jgi:Holliday junction DNA helicase RuvA
MISRLVGTLAEVDLTEITVDVHGVGYEVLIPMSTYDRLPPAGGEVRLYIHTHVREDILRLYGFSTKEERALFRLLITTANGVGPKLALNILSFMPIGRFCEAIVANDIKALSCINGIGKRTAEKLVVELKTSMDAFALSVASSLDGKPLGATALSREAKDAIAALETLGFKLMAAEKAVKDLCAQLPEKEQTAENLIRRALSTLNS